MSRTIARGISGFLILIFINVSGISAQLSDSRTADITVVNRFGSIAAENTSKSHEYINLHASIDYLQGSLKDFSRGETLFIQETTLFTSWFPRTKGDFIALADTDGYIHVFCGNNLKPALEGRTDGKLDLSIFDRGRKAWVNPAFFIKGIIDTAKPQITGLALEKDGVEFDFKDSIKSKKTLSQGSYSLLTSIMDEKPKQTSSGLLRIKAVLDGVSVIDNKLDLASAGMEGLALLGYPAPSARALGWNSRLKAGEVRLLRGDHTLELFVYDFAGNEATVSWKLRIE